MSLKALWPVGLTALPMGVIAFCLLLAFPEAIEVYDAGFAANQRGGPQTLFMLNSCVFGWLCVMVTERRVSAGGLGAFLFAIPWCLGSIIGSFALAAVFVGSFSDATWEMLAGSLVTVAGACAIRAWWGTVS